MKAKKLWITFVVSSVIASSFNYSYAAVLHEINQTQQVTNGATHISKEILTSEGWQDLNILRIDLSNPNVELKPITTQVLGERDNILNMATQQGAVAAVNADYFDMSSKTPAFGPVVSDGTIDQAYNNDYNTLGPAKYMGTLLVGEDGTASMDYYSVKMWVEIDGQKAFDLSSYNRIPSSVRIPFIIDRSYYTNNQALITKYQSSVGLYTILVEDDEVTYVSSLNEVVEVPKNGYAIMVSGDKFSTYGPYLTEGAEINIAQVVSLNNAVVEQIENLQMAVGGGGLILKNGAAYQGEAHKVSASSKEPRTIVANTYKENEILLITIDGRLSNTLGATHQDMITILQNLGAKDAMYLDGGGSTTLVARNEGETTLTIQNRPSGTVQRNVANGIGVFTTNATGEVANLTLEPSSERTFVGESITFNLKATDKNGNPVQLNQKEVSLSIAGVTGDFSGFKFSPKTTGNGLVVATVGDVSATAEIKVTQPKGLMIEPATLQLDENATKQVQVYGVDSEGYKIPITTGQITWKSKNSKVSAAGTTIAATSKAIDQLEASYQGATGKVNVVVGPSVVALESFEESLGKWAAGGSTVEGKVEASKEVKYHGNQSIKMTYTFNKDSNKQVAYTVFDKPIVLTEDAKSLNMWISANGQGDTLKVQVEDAKGKVHYLTLADSLNHTGWKYMSAALPNDIAMPAKATKLYVYSANGSKEKRTSAIYMDHVSMTRGDRNAENSSARSDYQFDSHYKPTLQAATGNQYSVKVLGPTSISGMVHSDETLAKMSKKVNTGASMIVQASKNNLPLSLSPKVATYNNTFGQATQGALDVIFVGTDNGGIRETNGSQWAQLKQSLEASTGKHIVLVMSKNPTTQFSDAREGKALHDYLAEYKKTTGKNVFVVTTGSTSKEVRIEDGIRYIRLNGLATSTGQVGEGEYLLFKVVGDDIYYTFESML